MKVAPSTSPGASSANRPEPGLLQADAARTFVEARLRQFGGAQAYEWNLSTNNVLALPGFATLFGLPCDQPVTSKDVIDRLHPEDRSKLEAAYQQALWCKGPYEQEFRVLLPDGSVRWLLSPGEVVCGDDGEPAALVGIVLDITRRKHAEIAVERREVELVEYQRRVLADTMPQIVWTARADGYPDYFNLRWYEFTGVPEGSSVQEEWRHLFHPDDLDRLAAKWYHSVETGETYEIEYRLRHKSGEYHWMLCRALPLRDRQGKIERWFGTFTDIHDLKETQQALAENKEFNSRLLSSLQDCVAVLDLDGHLRFMNEGGQRAMEVGDFKWIDGSHWLNFWTDPTAPVRTAIERAGAGAGETSRFESYFPTLAGATKWWDVLVTPMNGPDGRPERILWISRDITERKRAEDSIAQMTQRYRLAARATNDATWDWDLSSDHHVWNEDVQWLFGYAPEEVGPIRWWEERIHPEDRGRVLRGLHAVIEGPNSHWSAEYRFRAADGSYAMVFDRGYVLRDEKGRAVRMTGVMLDITERKRVEEQQALVNRELHHRVKNALTTVQALISSTARRAQTIPEFQQAVTERIISLAKTHTLLIENERDWAALHDIMKSELEAYDDGTGQRVRLNGPDVLLPSEIAVVLGMALHELATNAAKHGALSLPAGHIDVSWSLEQQSGERKLALHWCERDGPPVTNPDKEGFGSMLLKSIGRQLSGEIDMIFAPSGLEVQISATLAPIRIAS